MKKLILPAFCLVFGLASVNAVATNNVTSNVSASFNNDERQAVKSEELPEGVKKTLASDAYKGWSVKEAALVSTPAAATATATDKAIAPYYEVVLTNEKETKTVKFQKDGSLLN